MLIVATTNVLADCPRSLARRYAERLVPQVLEPPHPPFRFTVQAVWRADVADPGPDWLMDQIAEAVTTWSLRLRLCRDRKIWRYTAASRTCRWEGQEEAHMRVQLGKLASAAAVALAFVAVPVAASAASDMYLQIDGIAGTSTDAAHQAWIEINSFSWATTSVAAPGGLSSVASQTSGGGQLAIVKDTDSATPQLARDAADRKIIPQVVLEVRKAGATQVVTYTMRDAVITGYTQTGTQESMSFNFAKYQIQYTTQNSAQTGTTVTGPPHNAWDVGAPAWSPAPK